MAGEKGRGREEVWEERGVEVEYDMELLRGC